MRSRSWITRSLFGAAVLVATALQAGQMGAVRVNQDCAVGLKPGRTHYGTVTLRKLKDQTIIQLLEPGKLYKVTDHEFLLDFEGDNPDTSPQYEATLIFEQAVAHDKQLPQQYSMKVVPAGAGFNVTSIDWLEESVKAGSLPRKAGGAHSRNPNFWNKKIKPTESNYLLDLSFK